MNATTKGLCAAAAAAAVLALGWWQRDSAPMTSLRRTLGLAVASVAPTTTETLHAAGVHKCQTPGGVLYVDAACPRGSRELAANGGTVTVMSFPKPAPAPSALASGVLGGPIVKGMTTEERDRLRERQIDDAASRQ
jgi:hypothetical protein